MYPLLLSLSIIGELMLISMDLLVAKKPTKIPETLSVEESTESVFGKERFSLYQSNAATAIII